MIMMKRSTKRILSVLLITAVVVILIWGIKYRFHAPSITEQTLLTYIPGELSKKQQLIGVIGINNFEDIYKNIAKSNFFTSFSKSGIYERMLELKFAEVTETDINLIMDVIGQELIIAAYDSTGREHSADIPHFVMLSKINDPMGIKNLIHQILKKDEATVVTHLGVDIDIFGEFGFYSILNGIFIAGNSMELIKSVIDIKKNVSIIGNFHYFYPWVEEKMDLKSDAFIWTSRDNILEWTRRVIPEKFNIINFTKHPISHTYKEFFIDKGIYSKTYHKLTEKVEVLDPSSAFSLSFIPTSSIVAGIAVGVNLMEAWQRISDSGFAELLSAQAVNFERDVFPEFKGEFGYAILGPTIDTIESIFPSIIIYGEVKNKGSAERISVMIENILQVDMKEENHLGISFKSMRIPLLLGQMIEMSVLPLKMKGRNFIVIATSREAVKNIIDISKGKAESLKQFSSFRELAKYFPKNYSFLFYADINVLVATVGVFAATLTGRTELRNFFETNPFLWVGPSGRAGYYSEDFLIFYSYIPIQDLEEENWNNIFKSLKNLLP